MTSVKRRAEDPVFSRLDASYRGQDYRLSYFDRAGDKGSVLYLHGLGCAKDDVLPMADHDVLAAFRLTAFDFPGCGETPYIDDVTLQIDDLVELTRQFVAALPLDDFVIVGHSMGGLVALLLCELCPTAVRGFVNIEGNLAPEDCMFSRKAIAVDFASFETTLFPEMKRGFASTPGAGFARYLATLERGASTRAYYDYAFQMVAYSDRGNLLDRFLALNIPTLFVYGSKNEHLSYLPTLRASSCAVARIENADHLPFHDNPDAFAEALGAFVDGL